VDHVLTLLRARSVSHLTPLVTGTIEHETAR